MLFIYRSNVPAGEVHRAALKIFHIASNGNGTFELQEGTRT